MTHPQLHRVIGPPGTGKTTKLIGLIEQAISEGVKPQSIGYFAFTKKAAEEAISRARTRFGFDEKQLTYFRTIHSLVFRQLSMRREQVMQWSHYRDLGLRLGLEFKGRVSADDGTTYGMGKPDRMLFIEGLARVRQQSLRDAWSAANETDIAWHEIEWLAESLKMFKRNKALMDFTDMLETFVHDQRATVPELDMLIIDEAQDLSVIQWKVVEKVAARAKRVYIAGDDDQAIYRWAGADVDSFMGLGGTSEVLDQSYRIPLSVHNVAAGITARMKNRTEKLWKPREEQGVVRRVFSADAVDFSEAPGWKEYRAEHPESYEWLLLARNGYMLEDLEKLCRRQGFSYESVGKNPLTSPALKAIVSWERMRKGRAITKPEAENVLKHISPARIPKEQRDAVAKLGDRATVVLNRAESPIWHEALDRISAEDREFFIAARKRGETLTGKPRIRISTIHTAKGGEADNVLLLTDMSQRTFNEMHRCFDDEARVWYVAVTRARKALHIVNPTNVNLSFPVA